MRSNIAPIPNLNFTAFDFETANYYPASACALGIVVVRAGKVTEQRHWLLRPPVENFNPEFIRLHGITPEKVCNQPTFHDIWSEISPYLLHSPVVAHNASFDLNVLTNTCRHFGLTAGVLRYLCSLQLSRSAWPSLPSHGLAAMANHLRLSLNHHDAASDALVCAQLTIAACQELGYHTDIDLPLKQHNHNPAANQTKSFALREDPQEIRKSRARHVRVQRLDKSTRTGLINNFHVTENSCTCPDYQERLKPCKHIYRLQMELAF